MLKGKIKKESAIKIKKSLHFIKLDLAACKNVDDFKKRYNDFNYEDRLKEVLYSSGYTSLCFKNLFKIKAREKYNYKDIILNLNGIGIEPLVEEGDIIPSFKLMSAGNVCRQSFFDCIPNVVDHLELFVDNNTGPHMILVSNNNKKGDIK